MHQRLRQAFSALSSMALILAAVGVAPAAAASSATVSAQNPPSPTTRPAFPPHHLSTSLPLAPVPATIDDHLKGATGKVQVMVELQGDPAVVSYAQAGNSVSTARNQLNTIKGGQEAVATALRQLGGTEIYRLQRVYNGIAVSIDASQLPAIRKLSGVKAVHALVPKKLDLTTSVPLIGAPALWDPGNLGLTGTGMKIGIIDSGIDYEHADFGGFGAITPTIYLSNDYTVVGDVPGFPSEKVAGGYDFAGDDYNADPNAVTFNPVPTPDPDPSSCTSGGDVAEHGTHVAGIAAGYGETTDGLTYTGTYTSSLDESQFLIGPGVAPGAQLYSLRVFGCNGSTLLAGEAIEWAVDPNGDGDFSDHLDVINMSLGADYGSPYDPDSVASNNAALANVIVVASAGNAGNIYDIVGSPAVGDRVIAVASSRDSSAVLDGFRIDEDGALSGTVQPGAESAAFDWENSTPLTGTLVYPPDTSGGQATGCFTFNITNTTAISGNIVLLDWDTPSCGGSVTRTGNAVAAGAIGVLIADDSTVFDLSITGSAVVPALSIAKSVGDQLKNNLPGIVMTFDHAYHASLYTNDASIVDTLSEFSSRGARIRDLALKPDITAPGETIFSASNGTGNKGLDISGTSMASPHVAGSMALLREMHPLWSVEELKALAMNTALQDLRTQPELTSTVYGPATSGAGRIELQNTLGTDQVAFNASGAGLVSVSFGDQPVITTTTVARHIRVENQGAAPITYTVSYSDSVVEPGVSFVATPASLVVPAGHFATVVVSMTADASQMNHSIDPSVTPDEFGSWMSDASGFVVLDTGVSTPSMLRVPVYAAARPASDMHATNSSLNFGADTTIDLDGTGVQTGNEFDFVPDITSMVVPFESQYQDQLGPIGVPFIDEALFKNIGITSDREAEGTLNDTEIYVGISTYANWSVPYDFDTEFDVYFDTDLDGNPDYVMFNTALPDETDTFITQLVNLNTFDQTPEDLINGLPGTLFDTQPWNTSVMVMPVFAADLGLTPGHSRFNYQILSFSREFGNVDISPEMSYDADHPGLDFNDGGPGIPIWADEPGDSIDVAYNSLPAYTANDSQGVLLLHLHNTTGNHDEVLPVTAPTAQLSTSAQSVLENVGTVNVVATLDMTSGVTVTVPYTVSGTATPGTDYTGFTNGNFIFAPGTLTATKALNVVNDGAPEPPETVIVTLGTPDNALPGEPSVETITLNDVRTAQLSAAAQSVAESAGTISIIATLNGPTIITVTVPYTVSGTATQGTDYTGFTAGSFTFAPGDTTASKNITIVDDASIEPSETIIVTLGTPVNATLGATKVQTITIHDNDLYKTYLPLVERQP
jgi:subtilisin family serine protease